MFLQEKNKIKIQSKNIPEYFILLRDFGVQVQDFGKEKRQHRSLVSGLKMFSRLLCCKSFIYYHNTILILVNKYYLLNNSHILLLYPRWPSSLRTDLRSGLVCYQSWKQLSFSRWSESHIFRQSSKPFSLQAFGIQKAWRIASLYLGLCSRGSRERL